MESSKASVIPQDARAGAVIVFYFPDTACIARANQLAESGLRVVVVDNTPVSTSESEVRDSASLLLYPVIHQIRNDENLGIASALNQGVELLLHANCSWVLMFDQDSAPSDALLAGLVTSAMNLTLADRNIAVVGPAYEDARMHTVAPFVRFRPFKAERIAATGDKPLDVDFLITSGSCLNLSHWKAIGPMDETLFIDSVDLEWCMRAVSKGFRVVGLPWLKMAHSLGGEPVSVFGNRYPTHSALRHYYMCRNVMNLCLRGYVPWTWKSIELIKMPLRLTVYAFFFKPGMKHLTMALRGILDGLLSRMGARHN